MLFRLLSPKKMEEFLRKLSLSQDIEVIRYFCSTDSFDYRAKWSLNLQVMKFFDSEALKVLIAEKTINTDDPQSLRIVMSRNDPELLEFFLDHYSRNKIYGYRQDHYVNRFCNNHGNLFLWKRLAQRGFKFREEWLNILKSPEIVEWLSANSQLLC